MNKVEALCGMDRAMMHEFSRRSVDLLRRGLRFKLILPLFSTLMDANVDKEVEKDVLVIRSAAAAFSSGVDEKSVEIAGLFRETTEVDKKFMEKLFGQPAAADICFECICYECIEEIRKKRIRLLISAVYAILSRWPDSISFREAAVNAFSRQDLEALLREILHLYTLETRELSNSFKLPFAKGLFLETLFNTMEGIGASVATEFVGNIFTGVKDPCQPLT
jgi:hypothetical protein